MATGDPDDILARLKTLIPSGWFAVVAPIRDAVLGGLAAGLSNAYGLLDVVRQHTRLSGTKGWLLDLAGYDFLGAKVLRRPNENDTSWRARIVREIFRERVTVKGIVQALEDLTGRTPKTFEMFSSSDCGGGYGVGQIAYNVVGAWGSLSYPNQIFITAYRPSAGGIPLLAGYGAGPGGYNSVGSYLAYSTLTDVITSVSDADIYATAAATVGAGNIAWVDIRT